MGNKTSRKKQEIVQNKTSRPAQTPAPPVTPPPIPARTPVPPPSELVGTWRCISATLNGKPTQQWVNGEIVIEKSTTWQIKDLNFSPNAFPIQVQNFSDRTLEMRVNGSCLQAIWRLNGGSDGDQFLEMVRNEKNGDKVCPRGIIDFDRRHIQRLSLTRWKRVGAPPEIFDDCVSKDSGGNGGAPAPVASGYIVPTATPVQESIALTAIPVQESIVDKLTKLANLRDTGVLSDEEFQAAKEKALREE